ncbi:MAG TPA: 3-dehydro-L-gulonate 2-dehydrogenase [Chitinophaga sp.]|uniref:3-dehydro-L-gulonate 2-dehydrogenase n=1 Tax=Chitinophaga sp. TaxID=1869181 RepID=UPI002DC03E00|nr:3-dehydro-L-gulonate 2-dehydrogenase [Chitinophaga sp.]HEU4554755.1 3-dehydro-L-gulonate 2-dehydrogenase [Chitinophaga sp.]
MIRIPFAQLEQTFTKVLLQLNFPEKRAALCAHIFAANSRDGVHSHGLNRFPVFVQYVKDGLVRPDAEPALLEKNGCLETWTGNLGPGMYNATVCMQRAIELAKENGIGCVTIQNTNHWMRGGTYGWQAANAGCIGICFTNAIAGMPAWGGITPALGNNPLVIAVPRPQGHVVLDMAMSQFSYGKMQEHELKKEVLPVVGGYDDNGRLTTDPAVIRHNKRALPIGFWKGSGLAMVLDVLLVALSGGRSTAQITADKKEFGVSQCFISLYKPDLHAALIEAILQYTRNGASAVAGGRISYPGENTLRNRLQSEQEGVAVNEEMWAQVQGMVV